MTVIRKTFHIWQDVIVVRKWCMLNWVTSSLKFLFAQFETFNWFDGPFTPKIPMDSKEFCFNIPTFRNIKNVWLFPFSCSMSDIGRQCYSPPFVCIGCFQNFTISMSNRLLQASWWTKSKINRFSYRSTMYVCQS